MFDAVPFVDEIEIYEVRMGEMWEAVDKFVVVEAETNFQGQPKGLNFQRLKARLPEYMRNSAKLHWHNCGKLAGSEPRDWYHSHRTCMGLALLDAGMHKGDLGHFADADEIVDPTDLATLRDVATSGRCAFQTGTKDSDRHEVADLSSVFPAGIRMQLHYYNYRFVSTTLQWHTDVHLFDGDLSKLKRGVHKFLLTGRGWHCSWCFRRIADYKQKFLRVSRPEELANLSASRFEEHLRRCACEGENLFKYSKSGKELGIVQLSKEVARANAPRYLVANLQRFEFLLPLDAGCKLDD